jgi:hypothetical protein
VVEAGGADDGVGQPVPVAVVPGGQVGAEEIVGERRLGDPRGEIKI